MVTLYQVVHFLPDLTSFTSTHFLAAAMSSSKLNALVDSDSDTGGVCLLPAPSRKRKRTLSKPVKVVSATTRLIILTMVVSVYN